MVPYRGRATGPRPGGHRNTGPRAAGTARTRTRTGGARPRPHVEASRRTDRLPGAFIWPRTVARRTDQQDPSRSRQRKRPWCAQAGRDPWDGFLQPPTALSQQDRTAARGRRPDPPGRDERLLTRGRVEAAHHRPGPARERGLRPTAPARRGLGALRLIRHRFPAGHGRGTAGSVRVGAARRGDPGALPPDSGPHRRLDRFRGRCSAVSPEEHEQAMELFRVAILGADPERFPALVRFARDTRPLGADRRAAFEEILAAQLAHIEAAVRPSWRHVRQRSPCWRGLGRQCRVHRMELIAQGRDADVYALDESRVLRRYRHGGPPVWSHA